MRTPAGSECPYYYADFHRGHQRQECRLVARTPGGGTWSPDLCARCRVPRIVLANACPNLVLEARVRGGPLNILRRVEVMARCLRTRGPVSEPEIGCGLCHESLPLKPEPPEAA
jgi:hypothetical protein